MAKIQAGQRRRSTRAVTNGCSIVVIKTETDEPLPRSIGEAGTLSAKLLQKLSDARADRHPALCDAAVRTRTVS